MPCEVAVLRGGCACLAALCACGLRAGPRRRFLHLTLAFRFFSLNDLGSHSHYMTERPGSRISSSYRGRADPPDPPSFPFSSSIFPLPLTYLGAALPPHFPRVQKRSAPCASHTALNFSQHMGPGARYGRVVYRGGCVTHEPRAVSHRMKAKRITVTVRPRRLPGSGRYRSPRNSAFHVIMSQVTGLIRSLMSYHRCPESAA